MGVRHDAITLEYELKKIYEAIVSAAFYLPS